MSILRELHKLLPGESYVFLADQKHVPYGEKTPAQLEDLAVRIGRFLSGHDIKLLVVACNTATCYAIDALRKKFSFPVVGTVPAIKPAAEASKTKTIAVLSTPATSRSGAIKNLISEHAQGVAVLTVGCRGLEDTVETGSLESVQTKRLLAKYVAPLLSLDVDQVVLGCTHYPFLRREIGAILGKQVGLIDSGPAIARRTKALLNEAGLLNTSGERGSSVYFTTADPKKFSRVASKLLSARITSEKALI
ncbi:MAG: glutamate racemase [Acidobacteria bacterium]|nr:glutamate racemase [Acidobacteriota bacterium]